ncbi:MAG: RING finger protein, partial [archaeon]|nr:RING finger protein [archaeon]
MTESEDIKSFAVSFFTNLKANLFWDNEGKKLTITSVSPAFEKFYGKKAPYELVFSQDDASNKEELMVSGSFLLNCMKEFLQDKGQTTLVKIDFDFDPGDEIKKYIRLKNCQLTNLNKKPAYDWLVRFTFLTTFQYLNEKEQILNPIYIKEKDVVKFNLEDYKLIEGKKEDIDINNLKIQYNLAKDYLKTLITPKIEKISGILNEKLEKEIKRVEQHYLNQVNEDSNNLTKSERQIKELKNQLANPEKNVDIDSAKIRLKRLTETTENLNSIKRKEALKKEEEFFIKDETNKHGLAIDNKVMNTTIAYFPIYTYSGYLKNPYAVRLFNIVYNPLTKDISRIFCEVCKKEIKEIYLCSSGHISCGGCLRACLECQKEYCTNCLK